MKREEFKGKNVAVLGLGIEGVSNVRFLLAVGAKVTVLDQKTEGELDEDMISELKNSGVSFMLGKQYLKSLDSFDIVLRSPGVKRNLAEIKKAEEKGVVITSQTKLFFELSKAPIIGVTGTKGKGTTASLIYEMLKEQGLNAYLGGNIGKAPLEFLDTLSFHSWVVLELSSFQLEDVGKSPADAKAMAGKPHIAVVLMITSEHLAADKWGTQNYHDDLMDYVNAKRNIVRFQKPTDYAVINKDYPASHESDIHTDAQVFRVSREREAFDQGCFVKDGNIVVRIDRSLSHVADDARQPFVQERTHDRSLSENRHQPNSNHDEGREPIFSSSASGQAPRIEEMKIIAVKEILLPGKHNLENVCAAVMAAKLAGVGNKEIAAVLRTFKGLEHRLELVGEVRGVKYYDDSFSTTPETAVAAVEAFENPKILILGGSGKSSDFGPLGAAIIRAGNVKAIIGIGSEWQRIKEVLVKSGVETVLIEGATDMEKIVKAAEKIAQPGDVVLLSPACASFDMFANYKQRGEEFKKQVKGMML